MGYVRLLEDYEDEKAGAVVWLPAVIERQLRQEGKALAGKAVKPDWEPAHEINKIEYEKRERPKRETIYPKPLNGTVKEIKGWLDKKDIDYPSNALKAELLEILENA